MALNIAAGGAQALSRVTNIVPANSDYTAILWVKLTGPDPVSAYRNYFVQLNGVATYTQWAGLFSQPIDNSARVDINGTVTTASTMIEDQWYPLGYVRSGNNHSFYFNFALIDTIVEDITSDSFTEQWLGNDTFSVGSAQFGFFREWNKAITSLAALKTEWLNPAAVDTTNLWADTPLVSDALDISGNGRDWTEVASPTYVDNLNLVNDPILPITYTITPADAQDVFDFYYLATETKVIGEFSGVSSLSGNYDPTTSVNYLVGTTWTSVNVLEDTQRPFQIPVNNGNIYQIKIVNFEVGAPGRDLIITFTEGPNNLPIDKNGLIFISEDDATKTFQISTVIDPVTGEILNLPRLVISSENGISGPNGNIILTGDNAPYRGKVYFLNNSYELLSTDTTTLSSSGQNTPPVSVSSNFFYAAQYVSGDGFIRLRRWDFDGVLDGTSWNLPLPAAWISNEVTHIAVNKDDTILYYNYHSDVIPSAPTNVIKSWDLVNDVALPDLYTTPAPQYRNADLCYTSDNFIYAAIYDINPPLDSLILKFTPAGVLDTTYQLDNSRGFIDHFAFGSDDTETFWVWQHLDPNPDDPEKIQYYFIKYQVSDGSELIVLTNVEDFSDNFGPLVDFGSTPPTNFGAPSSCPLIITIDGEIPPPMNPLSGIYKIIPWSRKSADTLYTSLDPIETEDVQIPRPFGKGPPLGQ